MALSVSAIDRYSSVQKVSFAALTIGFLLCAIGNVPNQWIEAELKVSDIIDIVAENSFIGSVVDKFVGDSSLVELHTGLWWYCLKTGSVFEGLPKEINLNKCSSFWGGGPHGVECQSTYEGGRETTECRDDPDFPIKHSYPMVIASIIGGIGTCLALICALIACCRCCCCKGGRTICHGILAFLSGACELTAVALFCTHIKSSVFMLPLPNASYGWAFYLFVIGSCFIMMASFALCFSTPDSTFPHVLPTMNQNQAYVHMQNEMNQVNGTDTTQLYPNAGAAQTISATGY